MAKKASILIVEDSFIVAYHLKTTLESEGYQVLSNLDSGEAALAFVRENKPDLVLMDIMLGGVLDGVETARIIRADYGLPIIYITALTDRDTIQRAKVTEPYGYLTKPFEDREIFTVIEMALYKHSIESKLKQSEERYFSTVRSISDAVVVLDQSFCITYINPSAEALLGYVFSEVNGKSVFEVFDLRDAETDERISNPLQCSIANARLNTFLPGLVLRSKQGTERYIGEGSMSPLIDNKSNCTGLVLIFKDLTQKIEHERLLENFEKERLTALLEGQEKERTRIAKDLHDGLGQMLTAIKLNIGLLLQQDPRAENLYKLIDDAVQESVRISENLVPSKLRDFDLPTCINSLCNQVRHATECRISFEYLGDSVKLDQNQKVNFFRIAQEAINNAIKHSDASVINVQLTQDEANTVLIVEDNGKGMGYNPSSYVPGNGLANMRDRASIMGGKFTIESDTARGTLIIVEAPFNN